MNQRPSTGRRTTSVIHSSARPLFRLPEEQANLGPMTQRHDLPPSLAGHVRQARERLRLPDEVGLALRAHRFDVRMSQRRYAEARGMSRSLLARLEAGDASMSLATVVDALEGTGFALFLGREEEPSSPPPAAADALVPPTRPPGAPAVPSTRERVPPDAWRETELLARVRGGGRRFPAHRRTLYVKGSPPLWWWMHEFFVDPSDPPLWYAPELDRNASVAMRRPVRPIRERTCDLPGETDERPTDEGRDTAA